MSKVIPTHRVVFHLKPSPDETPAWKHLRPWFSYDLDSKPPIADIFLCGPVVNGQSIQFSIAFEDNANRLIEHLYRSGWVEKHSVLRI